MKVRTLVMSGFGINCEAETADAFRRAGAEADCVHVNDLIAEPQLMQAYQILAIPGGFSYGDDIASGKIFANRLRFKLGDAIRDFVAAGKLAVGICNGFQVMVKMGLLPLFEGEFVQEVTLTHNDRDRFDDRWVHLKKDADTVCVWLNGVEQMEAPIRHGEGKFIPRDSEVMARLQEQGQVALRYVRADGQPASGKFPANPNGSVDDIAGICDPSGRILGLMPHPEAFLTGENHPNWTGAGAADEGAGLVLFKNAVAYAESHLCGVLT